MRREANSVSEPRWWDVLAAVLLVFAVLTAATRLSATRWTDDLEAIRNLTFLGVIAGLALGQSRFSPKFVFLFGLIYGVFSIPWQLGLSLDNRLLWNDRLAILLERFSLTFTQVMQQKPVSDSFLFVLLMAILFWTFSLHAGYSLVRYASSWRAILPMGLAVFAIHYYDSFIAQRSWLLAAYLLFGLLLVARMTFVQQRMQWQLRRAHLPPEIGFDWIRLTFAVVILLVLLSWTVPVTAKSIPEAQRLWQFASKPWAAFRDRFSNVVSSLRATVGFVNEYYGENLALGVGSNLTDVPVFTVEAPPYIYTGMRYYWRARVYDQYEDGSWKSTFTDTQLVSPNDPDLSSPLLAERPMATFIFTPYSSFSTMMAVPQPVWFSRNARMFVDSYPDGSLDPVAIQSTEILQPGEAYRVRSSLNAVSVAELRTAGVDYPEWIAERYLQLPDEITPRTEDLALLISEGLDNPYDIATAITNYLRANIEYSATVPAPPSDQERVDWLLFDLQQGFCNYYASAQVILLRSLGIPARLAVGYAQGELLPVQPVDDSSTFTGDPRAQNVNYLVRQQEAHAWPEVYFPGIGWVEFEPTASQFPLIRPSGSQEIIDDEALVPQLSAAELRRLEELLQNEGQGLSPTGAAAQNLSRLIWAGLALLAIVIVALLALLVRRTSFQAKVLVIPIHLERGVRRLGLRPPAFLQRWAHYASLSPLARSYLEINRALARLGNPPGLHQTPAERAASLEALMPVASLQIHNIVDSYHLAIYGLQPDLIDSAPHMAREIRNLSFRLMINNLLSNNLASR